MRFTVSLLFMSVLFVLTACGDSDKEAATGATTPAATPSPSPAAPSAPAAEAAPEEATASAPAEDAPPQTVSASAVDTVYIDHSKDEIEFQLKSTISGLEDLVSDLEQAGADASAEAARLAEAKEALSKL